MAERAFPSKEARVITDIELNNKRLDAIREFVREVAIPAESEVAQNNFIPEPILNGAPNGRKA